MRPVPRLPAVLAALALALAGAACGGDDDTDVEGSLDASVDDTADGPDDAFAPSTDTDDRETDTPTEPAPDQRTGTITVAGMTTELTTDDFAICETVNPAFDDAINIITALSDGTYFRLSGTLGDMDEEFDGVVLGEIPEEEHATDLDVGRDGRTVSGTAMVEAGEVTFSFTC